MSEVKVLETRGSKRKYDFSALSQVGSIMEFENTTTNTIRGSAMYYIESNGLDWNIRCYTQGETVCIVRTK